MWHIDQSSIQLIGVCLELCEKILETLLLG